MPFEVFAAFFRLGLISFGGPIAHLGYFRDEFVSRRRWLVEEDYARVVALCQVLPGPASSQVGIIIGYMRAGALGSIAAWCGFTLPSAFLLVAFAYGIDRYPSATVSHCIHGLLVAAVAVVAVAVATMARTLAPDRRRRSLSFAVAIAALIAPSNGYAQLVLVVAGALYGVALLSNVRSNDAATPPIQTSSAASIAIDRRAAFVSAIAFLALVVGLPIAERFVQYRPFVVFEKFFEVGGLSFGGGHVVLPMLAAQVVEPGWISSTRFLAGYGAAQAVPGPLFAFAAYLGFAMNRGPVDGFAGAALCLAAIFLPSFLLVAAALPFLNHVRENATAGAALLGVNASVVGLLVAALYDPVWVSAVRSTHDVAIVLADLLALGVWRVPPWIVVFASAFATAALER